MLTCGKAKLWENDVLIIKRGDHTYNHEIQLVLGMFFLESQVKANKQIFSRMLINYVVIQNVLQANPLTKLTTPIALKTSHPSSTCSDRWHLDRYIKIIMEYSTRTAAVIPLFLQTSTGSFSLGY